MKEPTRCHLGVAGTEGVGVWILHFSEKEKNERKKCGAAAAWVGAGTPGNGRAKTVH